MIETLRVLLVEDSEGDSSLLLEHLRPEVRDLIHHRVDTEPALLAALEGESWDIVLSDLAKPQFNGLRAFEVVRNSGRDIPFIVVTDHIGEGHAAEAMRRGAADYVLKDNLTRLVPAIIREMREAKIRREHRRAEGELRASQRLLRTVFDTIPYSLIVKDQEGRYLMVNKAWGETYGHDPAAVLHKHVRELPRHSREEVERAVEQDRQVLSGEVGHLAVEGTETAKGGELRHFQRIKVPIKDEIGGIVGLVVATVDLTERKRAEEELQVSQLRLQTVFDTIPHPLFMKDAAGRYLMVNRAWCERYRCAPEDVIGNSTLAVPSRTEDDKRRSAEEDRRVMIEEQKPVSFRGTDTAPGGTLRHFQSFKAPIKDSGGAVTGLVGVVVDTTEIMRAEEELQASQRLLQTVFDTIPHHLIVKDRESRYLMVNKAWCEAFGRKPEEVLYRLTSEQSSRPADEVARFLEEDRRVLNGESVFTPMQGTITVKTGEKRYFKGIKAPLRNEAGEIDGLVAISMDVTAELEAQRKADTAHARLFDAIESLPAAFMMFDAEEKLLLWNHRAVEFFREMSAHFRQGISYEELVRLAAAAYMPQAGEDAEKWIKLRLDKLRNQPGTSEERLTDGRCIQGIDHRTSDGGTVFLGFDVTEVKVREAALRQAQKMEAIGNLAGGVAHDFNNLLTVISAHAEFILDAASSPDSVRDAQIIRDTSERAAALTHQLLAFSRRQVLRMLPLNINRTIGDIENILRRLIGENIEMRTSLPPTLRRIDADKTQIEQIILNLAVNARDAMPRGGKLLIETANQTLDASYSAVHPEVTPGDYVMLAVTDNGIGMDLETQKRIFEPFFTTKPLGEGTGLGLATVYGIVKQMKGFIYVYSEPGKGTSFKVYFPEATSTAGVVAKPVETAACPPATGTVLLVEDEELVRGSAVRILENAGYLVRQATDVKDALAICANPTETIDLMLSDVVMPGLSGRELWDHVRKLRPMRVIFMSGYTDDAVVRHGILEGSVPFLSKPFTKQTLLAKVREVLDAPIRNGSAAS